LLPPSLISYGGQVVAADSSPAFANPASPAYNATTMMMRTLHIASVFFLSR